MPSGETVKPNGWTPTGIVFKSVRVAVSITAILLSLCKLAYIRDLVGSARKTQALNGNVLTRRPGGTATGAETTIGRTSVFVSPAPEAVMVTEKEPLMVGTPLIRPVAGSILNPGGRFVAAKLFPVSLT